MLLNFENRVHQNLLDILNVNSLRGFKFLLAVSGGMDSIAMYNIFFNLSRKHNFNIAIANVNYKTSKYSEESMLLCKRLSHENKHPFYLREAVCPSSNFEKKARDLRYSFFNNIIKKEKYDNLITGHHKNDLIETLFMREKNQNDISLIPFNNFNVLRPLLTINKEEIVKFIKYMKYKFINDPSNLDLNFKRNKIRHSILPEINKSNIFFKKLLKTNNNNIKLFNDFIEKFHNEKNNFIKYNNVYEMIVIDRKYLSNQSNISYKLIIQGQISYYYNIDIRKSKGFWEELYRLIKTSKKNNSKLSINRKIDLFINKNFLFITLCDKECPSRKLTNSTQWLGGSFEIFKLNNNYNKRIKFIRDYNQLICPKNLITDGLYIRRWHRGDKININKINKKKVSKLFNDKKITVSCRKRIPMITYNDKIIWIPGITIPYNNFIDQNDLQIIKWIC